MKTGSLWRGLAGLARRFLRHERGSISPIFVLMAIPICGVMAMAVELGEGTLLQRVQQHAADSAALAAATGNNTICYTSGGSKDGSQVVNASGVCTTTGDTPGFVLEAKAVSGQYPIGNSTVSTVQAYGPGTTTGGLNCYKVTIQRTVPFYLGQVVGIQNMTPTAIAYASTSISNDDCFVATSNNSSTFAKNGDAIYLKGQSDLGNCWMAIVAPAASKFIADCSGSVNVGGVQSATPPKTCGGGYVNSSFDPSGWIARANAAVGALPTLTTISSNSKFCSSDINSLVWTDGATLGGNAVSGVQYAMLSNTPCGGSGPTLTVSGTVELNPSATTPRVLILDGVGLNVSGILKATGEGGTTIVATEPSGTATATGLGGASATIFQGQGQVNITAPLNDTFATAFANLAIVGDPTYTGTSSLDTSGTKNNDFSILGDVITPYSDFYSDGSSDANLGSTYCMSVIANSIQSNGSKFGQNDLSGGCSVLGYLAPTTTITGTQLVQ